MSDDRATLAAERADLMNKLRKRENRSGFASNVAAIKERLAAIDEALGPEEPGPPDEPPLA